MRKISSSSAATSMHGNGNKITENINEEILNDKKQEQQQRRESEKERSVDEKVTTRELTEFEKLLNMEDDDDDDDDDDDEEERKKIVVEEKARSIIISAHDNIAHDDDYEDEEAVLDLVGSDQYATVFVGTSKQSHLEASTTLDDVLEEENVKRERSRRMTVDTELQTTINRAIAEDDDEFAAESSEYLDMPGDEAGTLTLIEEDDVGEDLGIEDDEGRKSDWRERKSGAELQISSELLGDLVENEISGAARKDSDALKEENIANLSHHRLRRTVMTILLTHKWQKVYPGRRAKKRAAKKMIRYEPTYRMEPKVNLNSVMYLIVSKVRHTFESLVEKHGKYDVEYTPRFLRIITEMIKNDVKSFRVDRYKIVVSVLIIKKVLHQSVQYVSRMLADQENDERICLNMSTKSFYAICLIFLVYHE